MGNSAISKCYDKHYESPAQLRARVRALEQEIKNLRLLRELEASEFEEKERKFGCREKEWRRERRRLDEESMKLRRRAEEGEERAKRLEEEIGAAGRDGRSDGEWMHWIMGTEHLVEHMKEEQAKREAAVEKWKHLYLTIKSELDDLILRTRQGTLVGVGIEECMDYRVQKEMAAKEETIEALQSRIMLMEKAKVRREREIDILRQSLRILSNTKKNSYRRRIQRRWLL